MISRREKDADFWFELTIALNPYSNRKTEKHT